MNTQRISAELVAVFIMTITLAYVLFVYSPQDKDQLLYFAGKFISVCITLPAFHLMRRSKKTSVPEQRAEDQA
jgi:hypothetical protein